MISKSNIFNKKNFNKLKFILFASFLFYFFSNNLIYAQDNKNIDNDYLIPIGHVLQLDIELENVVVRNYVDGSPFMIGDSIIKIDNSVIDNYGELSSLLESISSSKELNVSVKRGEHTFNIKTTKDNLEKINCNNLISGFATLTYVNPKTSEFGAVAHPISLAQGRIACVKNGTISTTDNLKIQKSSKGNVGCLCAERKDTIGKFNVNNDFGIKGNIAGFNVSNLKAYKVASLNEVKLGKAQIILQTDKMVYEKFDIQILNIENQKYPKSKTFKIKITDNDLIRKTGGIVQGMSGAPIVQGDNIIGAVSHAIENDPTTGYAVFIKWMLQD